VEYKSYSSHIHPEALKRPLTLQTPTAPRKVPKPHVFAEDLLENFSKNDTIKYFEYLSRQQCSPLKMNCFIR